ncbi:unnamed protein product [Allacma fusca]|uniref:Uncharacterized protein n=1 Tax=Allacma fusca TaxID=39272 RepID=A0A8J2K3I5_9HEXA|nr:unnamed protein product [Allacma fusca]
MGRNCPNGKGHSELYTAKAIVKRGVALFTRRGRFSDMKFDVKIQILDFRFIREVLEVEGAMDFFGMAHAQLLDLQPMANFTRLIINPPEQSGVPDWILLAAAFGVLAFLILIIFDLAKGEGNFDNLT